MADVQNSERKVKLCKNGKVVKKRTRNPEEWHKQKQKRLRIAGKEYISSNGKVVPGKQPGPDCNCRRRCYQRVPEDVRLKTFQGFYSMKTHDEQNAYLFGLMRQVDVKRKRVKASSRRTCTFEYFVRVRGRETQVCQTAFKNIHAITERKVRVLCKKMDDGVMFPSDNRGKNSHRREGEIRLPPNTLDQVRRHIYSIVHTHRLKDFIRLDKVAGLEINISKMWKDYIRTHDPVNIVATLPKSKRSQTDVKDVPLIPAVPVTSTVAQPQQTEYPTYQAPAGTQIVSIGDNYFQNQYGAAVTPNFYQTANVGGQSVGILLQAGTRPQPQTFIVVQAKQEPETITALPLPAITHHETVHSPPPVAVKKERKRGPTVKQWRYTSIFHEEINGAALSAIKTRLAMYYAESDAARKKHKARAEAQTQVPPAPVPIQLAQAQTIVAAPPPQIITQHPQQHPQQMQQPPHEHIRQTVTIYT